MSILIKIKNKIKVFQAGFISGISLEQVQMACYKFFFAWSKYLCISTELKEPNHLTQSIKKHNLCKIEKVFS